MRDGDARASCAPSLKYAPIVVAASSSIGRIVSLFGGPKGVGFSFTGWFFPPVRIFYNDRRGA